MKIYKYYARLSLACASLAASLLLAGPSAASVPAYPTPVSVDISSLRGFIDTLPTDEQEEQLRDLAAYGLKSQLGVANAEEAPIRYPALKDASPGEVSKGRVFPLSRNEWAVLLSKDLLGNKPLIGGLIDRKYAQTNALPEKISLFSYDCTPTSSSIDVTFEGTVDAADLFTAAYGYATATVSTLSDLGRFLAHVDDIVMVQWQSANLVLGGRSYGQDGHRSVTIEQLAAVYQAYNIPGDPRKYEAFIRERYGDMLRLNSRVAHPPATGSVEEEALLARIRRQFPHARNAQGDTTIGFSLDPDIDFDAFADDMEEFARTTTLMQALDYNLTSPSELAAIARRIRSSRDLTSLVALFRRLYASGGETDMRIYSALYSIQQYHSYQKARYDGNLQGTEAGMMLFYTDLLAKLWAVDYDGMSTGIGVKGFRPMTEIRIPKQYWQGYGRSATTRLWFGLKLDGFDVYGNKALFQPIATHVYASSFDLLIQGKESVPNFQGKEFLGWWDRHYEAVADKEPEYYALNQLQKWSCIVMLLKENNSHHLDFLLNIPVKRDHDFAAWNKNNDLKTKISISFLDKHKYGRGTECLPLISSKPFPFLAGYGVISGGVTLATQKDIQAKLQKKDPAAAPAPLSIPMPFGTMRKWPVAPAAPGPSPQQAQGPIPQKGRVVAETQRVPEIPAKSRPAGGTGEKQASLKLSWEKSPSLEAMNLVTALAALQQPNAPASKGEAIFRGMPDIESVVRIKDWDTYLIKTRALKEMWIYLSVNPSNVAAYPAVAAGSFAEADIFCARPISTADAQKLAQGKQVIR